MVVRSRYIEFREIKKNAGFITAYKDCSDQHYVLSKERCYLNDSCWILVRLLKRNFALQPGQIFVDENHFHIHDMTGWVYYVNKQLNHTESPYFVNYLATNTHDLK